MDENYRKAYVEILQVLKYVPKEDRNKIPKEIIRTLKEKADSEYSYKIDTNIPFEQQNLLNETKSILANFYRDYWATDFQREQIIKKEQEEENKLNEELSKKYNSDNLLKNRKKNYTQEESKELIVVEKIKWYQKIFTKIKNIFIKRTNTIEKK